MRLIVAVLPFILSVVAGGESSSSITHRALQVGSLDLQRLLVFQASFFLNRIALNTNSTTPIRLRIATSGSRSQDYAANNFDEVSRRNERSDDLHDYRHRIARKHEPRKQERGKHYQPGQLQGLHLILRPG